MPVCTLQAFLSGQKVSGTLHFTLTEAKSYKHITLGLYGGALVRWTETYTSSDGQSTTTYTVTYQSKETYVEQATVLWNSEQSPDGRIGPGTYSLPFEFMLPSTFLDHSKGVVVPLSMLSMAVLKQVCYIVITQ